MSADARRTLHLVATHVLARARYDAVGRIGLRPSPGGIATPAFRVDATVVRTAGSWLVVERGDEPVVTAPIDGASLRDLAAVAGVDLGAELAAGRDAPPVGDPRAALALDHGAALDLAAWFGLGWRIVDEAVVGLGTAAAPSRQQLWPEHFDVGCSVATGTGADQRCNLGASPGDGPGGTPYLYVGPFGADRPGGAGYWNAPFGATIGRAELEATSDPVAAGVAFLRRGVQLLRAATGPA